jgi:hypothetical protein
LERIVAQTVYGANLSSVSFPFTIKAHKRTVIVKQYDQVHTPTITSQTDLDKDTNVPQLFYGHNIFPTGEGYQLVDYNLEVEPHTGSIEYFVDTYNLRDDQGHRLTVGISLTGKLYCIGPNQTEWALLVSMPEAAGKFISTAYVSGTTYLYIQDVGCYKYEYVEGGAPPATLLPVTLEGLDIGDIVGILAAQGYLVAYSKNASSWSSLTDVTDFTPSLSTGAGGGNVEQIRGNIIFAASNVTGFIIYTEANAVVATYSGNERFPFNFREIATSGGITSNILVAHENNSATHFAYTTSGIQQISGIESKGVFPELTDFLAGKFYDEIELYPSPLIVNYSLGTPLNKRLAFISDRYLVISYGSNAFTYAIVYDAVLERFGKVKLAHTKCFEWVNPTEVSMDAAKSSLAFLQLDGTVVTVNFSQTSGTYTLSEDCTPCAVFGRYQLVRSRLTQLCAVEVETVQDTDTLTVYDMYSMDGKNFAVSQGTENSYLSQVRKYFFRATALNHSICIIGRAQLSSLQLHITVADRRPGTLNLRTVKPVASFTSTAITETLK